MAEQFWVLAAGASCAISFIGRWLNEQPKVYTLFERRLYCGLEEGFLVLAVLFILKWILEVLW